MSTEITLPYYPGVVVHQTKTLFGMTEIDMCNPYEYDMKDKRIIRFDLLSSLSDIWGENILGHRNIIYKLLSGTLEEDMYANVLTSFYRRFVSFANYCDQCCLFGNKEVPLLIRIVDPALKHIEEYEKQLMEKYQGHGSKYLVTTHGYIYFSFFNDTIVKEIGAQVIACR